MLLFNESSHYYVNDIIDFNTSNVTIQPTSSFMLPSAGSDFNTSNVTIQLVWIWC